jgi:outer membrane receptor protein involved in Fe transport
MSGLDVGVFYDFNFRDVSNSLVFRASYLADYEITSFDGDEPFVLAGGVGCCIGGFPEWKANGQWNIARGKWSGSWNVQMVGSATDFNGKPGEIGTNIAPIFYHNVQAGYQFSDSLLLHFGVDNLFDQDAPFVRSASDGNTDTFTYQLLGRAVYANVRLSVL